MRRRTRLPLLLLAVGLSACSSSGAVTQARSTPTPTPSETPAVVITPTATSTPSARPTPTRSPTHRPTPRATTPPPVVVASGSYVFPVACKTSYGHSHHDYPATDIFAARGCHYVAPIAGTVDEVTYVDRWSSSTNRGADRGGLSVSIVGTDGVRYYGSHFERIAAGIKPGLHVARGALLAYVGNTGSARGIATHVHFGVSWPTRHGIWWVRRGEVYPWPYLDSWKAGGHRSPAAAVEAKRAKVGTVPPCTSYC